MELELELEQEREECLLMELEGRLLMESLELEHPVCRWLELEGCLLMMQSLELGHLVRLPELVGRL